MQVFSGQSLTYGRVQRNKEEEKMKDYDYTVTMTYERIDKKYVFLFTDIKDAISFIDVQMTNPKMIAASLERRRRYV